MSDRLGVVGLGRMGLPIFRALEKSGAHVAGTDIDPVRMATAGASGGSRLCANARELAAEVDILITVLPGPPECEDVMLGGNGALEVMGADSLWLDLTSNDPAIATRIAEAAAGLGIDAVGAPMRGGPAEAASGGLGFYLGGADAALERVRPVLTALGDPKDARRVGRNVTDGYVLKLIANGLWFTQVVAVTESLLLAGASGIDVDVAAKVLADGPAGSAFLDDYAGRLLDGDYSATFGLDRVVEELATLRRLAIETGSPFELGSVVGRLHDEALERFGAIDGEMLAARLLDERAARRMRPVRQVPPTGGKVQ